MLQVSFHLNFVEKNLQFIFLNFWQTILKRNFGTFHDIQNLCFFFVWEKFFSFFVSFENLKTSSNHEFFFKGDPPFFYKIFPFWVKMEKHSIQCIFASFCLFLTLIPYFFTVFCAFFKKVEVEVEQLHFVCFQITWLKDDFFKYSGARKTDNVKLVNFNFNCIETSKKNANKLGY